MTTSHLSALIAAPKLSIIEIENPDPGVLVASNEWRSGDLCPSCLKGHLDYDGLLNLGCPRCGYTLVGCFT